MFFTQFVICMIVSSFTTALILLIRNVFRRQLSAKWQYNLWFLLLIALMLPFIPGEWLDWGHNVAFDFQHGGDGIQSDATERNSTVDQGNWMKDFSVSVNKMDLTALNDALVTIWGIGVLIMTLLTGRSWLLLKRIKNTSCHLENQEILHLFEQCKQRLNITGNVKIVQSSRIQSPLTFGLFNSYVVLPMEVDEWLSIDDIEHILLHELHHYRSKDIVTNYVIAVHQILYWFNPVVWIAFKKMKLDREIACDIAVLNTLKAHRHTAYGYTILKFIDSTTRRRSFSVANQLDGSKEQITRRIETIASFTNEPKLLKWKSIAIFMLLSLVVIGQIPIVSAIAQDDLTYDFDEGKVIHENLSRYFTGYDGAFVLYDLQADQYRIYNEDRSTKRISPDSTYKIYSALFALESNVITGRHSTLEWDGEQHPYDAWNEDQTLRTALQNSVNWYFQRLDRTVGREKLQAYLNRIGYGNTDLSGGVSQFWLESTLKISPIEQVLLLTSMYTNEFGFDRQHVQVVKDAMQLEKKGDTVLYGKTGTGNVNGNEINGWFIGFVETDETTYFFATNIQGEGHSNGSKAARIAKSILHDKGIY